MISTTMPMYRRMKSCGVQKQGADKRVISGVLEDELYAMQCEILVDWPSLTIESIQARLKRFTTIKCILAEKVFLRSEGWKIDSQIEGKIKKELGRNGCRHMAALMIDCLRSLARSELANNLRSSMESEPNLDKDRFIEDFFKDHPDLKGLAKIS
ncbi:MAG: DUF2889 domain-containing protein [Syntrophaceae bacterium]|nr:DUF2889 domain-containing protein [Syntrophaceae bacterium]